MKCARRTALLENTQPQQPANPFLSPPAGTNLCCIGYIRKFIWISEINHAIMKHVKTEGNENIIPKMKGEEIWEEQLR